MKKLIFSILSLLLGLILFFWLFNQIGWHGIKQTFSQLSGVGGIIAFILAVFYTLFGALRWREILKNKGFHFSVKELYGSYLASFAITYLAPLIFFGGEVFRGYILNQKKQEKNSLGKGIAASMIDGIFEYASEFLIVVCGIIALFFTIDLKINILYILIGSVVLIILGIIFYYFFIKKKSLIKIFFKTDDNNHGAIIEKEIISFFDFKNHFFQKAALFSFVKIMLRFFQYWILLEFLGESVSLVFAISTLGVSVLSMLLPVSADIGTHDFGLALLFEKMGLGREAGVVFASVIRGINLILSVFGIVFLIKTGIQMFQDKISDKIDKLALVINKARK